MFIYLGSVGSLHLIWDVADTLKGLMAIPNLIAVFFSIPFLLSLQKEIRGRARLETLRAVKDRRISAGAPYSSRPA